MSSTPYIIIISFPSFVDIQGLAKVLKLKKVRKEKPKKVILRKIFFEKLFSVECSHVGILSGVLLGVSDV